MIYYCCHIEFMLDLYLTSTYCFYCFIVFYYWFINLFIPVTPTDGSIMKNTWQEKLFKPTELQNILNIPKVCQSEHWDMSIQWCDACRSFLFCFVFDVMVQAQKSVIQFVTDSQLEHEHRENSVCFKEFLHCTDLCKC